MRITSIPNSNYISNSQKYNPKPFIIPRAGYNFNNKDSVSFTSAKPVEVINTLEKAVKKLNFEESGLYAFIGKEYVKLPIEKYHNIYQELVTRIVMKFKPEKFARAIAEGEEKATKETITNRKGVFPALVTELIDQGVKSATIVVDGRVHILKLPKLNRLREQAINVLSKAPEMKVVGFGNSRTEDLFKLTEQMIKNANIDGLSLKKLPLKTPKTGS